MDTGGFLTPIHFSGLTGEELYEAVLLNKSTARGLHGWASDEIEALSLSRFFGFGPVLRQVESAGQWPQGLLDVFIAMNPWAEGDSTPLGQRPFWVLSVVYRIWSSVRLAHIQECFFFAWAPSECLLLMSGIPPQLT